MRIAGSYAYIADFLSPTADLIILSISPAAKPAIVGQSNAMGNLTDVDIVNGILYATDGRSGLRIIDVYSPSSPTIKSTYNSSGDANDVKIVGSLAYLAEGISGLQIVNISNANLPVLQATADSAIGVTGSISAVDVAGNLAVVASKRVGTGRLQTINVSDPKAPRKMGETLFTLEGAPSTVQIVGSTAYLAAGNRGLKIFDISNPSTPIQKGEYFYNSSAEAYDVQVVSDYAFVAYGVYGLEIIDIRNPSSPTLAASYKPSTNFFGISQANITTSVEVAGELAYLTVQASKDLGGLWILDVSSFTTPIPPPAVSLTLAVAPNTGSAEDGSSNLIYTFSRTGPTTSTLTVNYTVGVTATLGTDYSGIAATPATKTVSFAAGAAIAFVTVDPTADAEPEANETVVLTLAAGPGYSVGLAASATGTITNDDVPSITLALSNAFVIEDGTTNLLYIFTRTGPSTSALTVNYTISVTATNGSDYALIPTTVTFAAGSATAVVTVDPTADTTIEANDTVALTLAPGTGYTIGTTTAVIGTITNDDLPTGSPSSTTTIYSGSFTTRNEVDSYSVDVVPGTIISASITTPSQQSLYPLINLFDASSSLLKGPLTYAKDFADLGMFDVITGKATLKVGTQTGFLGDYELNLSFINREAVKNEVVILTNAQRLQAGLNPLTRNLLLESAAQAHVADMDASNRYLAHTGSNGSDPVTRIAATGYKGGWVDLGNGRLRTISSENAAAGQKTPAEVVNAWMNSPGHRAAILDPYTKEIGIGFEFDNEVGDITAQSYKIGTTYWVQNFGHPWQTGMQVWF